MAIPSMPTLGMGTWRMGERKGDRAREVEALRAGLELGVALIDTAEMYGDGGAEAIVGEAIAGRRDELYLVSKCYPHHAGAKTMPLALDRSLRRLRIERLDCYLLHWRGRVPLAETVETFERLVREGKIASWGVSNFDVDDMDELFALPSGRNCAANQVLYHLADRAPEWRLLEQCRRHDVTLMAYSPLGEGNLLRKPALRTVARSLGATPAQVALAFLMAREGVVAIPKSARPEHWRDNVGALSLTLDDAALARIDAAFPPPAGPSSISIV